MHHARFDDAERAPQKRERSLGGQCADGVPKVRSEGLDAHRRGIDRRVGGNGGQNAGQASRMVHLGVIADDRADLIRRADCGNARQKFVLKPFFDGVNENISVVPLDEIGIVGRSASRFVPVKLPQRPVNGANPVNRRRDLYGLK